MRRLIATATIAVLLAGGTVAAGAAVRSARHLPQSLSPSEEHSPDRREGFRRRVLAEAVRVASETIGVEQADLVAAVRSGSSVAEVATEHGVDPDAVVGALVSAAEDAIAHAVGAGRLGTDRAAALSERASELASRLVASARPAGSHSSSAPPRPHATLHRRAIRAAVGIAAQTIGVEPSHVVRAHRAGHSIGDLAAERGVLPQTVIDALVEAATVRLDEATSSGRLDAERAARLLERLPNLARRFVETQRSIASSTAAATRDAP